MNLNLRLFFVISFVNPLCRHGFWVALVLDRIALALCIVDTALVTEGEGENCVDELLPAYLPLFTFCFCYF